MSASLVGSEMCIRDRSTRGSLSSSCMLGRSHEAAVAGCSCRKCAPRASWGWYSLITNSVWTLAFSSRSSTSS
eukprot:6413346-Alexandrium_andersonii.AAC.1